MLKRYSFDGERPFEDEPFGVWVKFEEAQFALNAKLDPKIKTALCGEIRTLQERVHALNNQLTAAILERDAFKRQLALWRDTCTGRHGSQALCVLVHPA